MPVMSVKFIRTEGETAWPEITGRVIHSTAPLNVAVLDRGMESGKPSVALRYDLPDGQHLIVETSALQILALARMIRSRHPGIDD